MPMTVYTVLQFLWAMTAYLFVTCFLPSIALSSQLSRFRLSLRFLFSFTFGNFYLINLVYLLEIFRFSNQITLVFFTILPVLLLCLKRRQMTLTGAFSRFFTFLLRLFSGQYGFRLLLLRTRQVIGKVLKRAVRWISHQIKTHPMDVPMLLGVAAVLTWFFGYNLVTYFGYGASDIVVHNLWVNGMDWVWAWPWEEAFATRNNIFNGGVYPFGMHNIIYYLHDVFWMDTYVLFRVFWLVQTIMVFLVTLAVMRVWCKTKYAPYLGLILYLIAPLYPSNYYRYYSTLPQEFGMLFILPPACFFTEFLRRRKEELRTLTCQIKEELGALQESDPKARKGRKKREQKAIRREIKRRKRERIPKLFKKSPRGIFHWLLLRLKQSRTFFSIDPPNREDGESNWHLFAMIMALSLSFTTHFYNFFIAAFYCIAVAIAFFFRLFRRGYFGRVVIAALLSIVISILPLAMAVAGGKPLQYSLRWGMSFITGTNDQSDEPEELEETEPAQEGNSSEEVEYEEQTIVRSTLSARLFSILEGIVNGTQFIIDQNIFNTHQKILIPACYLAIALLLILGLLFWLIRRIEYGAMILSGAISQLLLIFLMISGLLGFPELMGTERSRVYFCYGLVVLWGLSADGVLYLLLGFRKIKWLMNTLSLICLLGITGFFYREGMLRWQYLTGNIWQSNGAVTCLTNIIHDNEDHTWTICSANDETQMVHGHGYHVETIDFLYEMEEDGESKPIPTPLIYFFVEKIPLNYNVLYEGSGQKVARVGADQELPENNGLAPYQGENRWIVMSKMYYWAEEFRRRFPDVFTVYYETDNFICYAARQNIARLYNFAIDY
ncbi:MAG: hypothetical protein LBM69_10135 [Lachnospiraceae bacterium]|jgi:hypothetical protein|nr:hypothetical protein [Lachnospiraceae bacterium]